MDSLPSFESLWNGVENFDLSEEPLKVCPFAQKFSTLTEDLLANVTKEPSIALIIWTKAALLDRYFEWYVVVPKSHRNRIRSVGHKCIFQVFIESCERLKAIELSLTPTLSLSQPVSSPPQEISGGIFIGVRENKLGKP